MHIYYKVWKLLLKINNKEQFQNNIKIIKKKIYKIYKFYITGS